MCGTCGCSESQVADPHMVELEQHVLAKNDATAQRNRAWLTARGIFAVNLMSSPGSGKTTLLERTVRELPCPISVVEGDQATGFDSDRIRETGAPVVQINTGAGCHLDAEMLERGLATLAPQPGSVMFVENVGNLVCPALFDLGETRRAVVMSVTEGADKPLKYPHMFRAGRVVLLNKIDLLPHVPFDLARFLDGVRQVNPDLAVIQASALRGDGLEQWYGWVREQLATRRSAAV